MKKKYILSFTPESTEKAITYELIEKYDVKINIIKANISANEAGHLLVELEANESDLQKSFEFLNEHGVEYIPAEKRIVFDEDKCVHCGSCTAVCFAGALTLDPETKKLQFDPDKCVFCKLCTEACPLNLFEIHFNE